MVRYGSVLTKSEREKKWREELERAKFRREFFGGKQKQKKEVKEDSKK